jgi:hypothetical protein
MEPEVAAEIVDSLKAAGIDFIPRRADGNRGAD